MNTYSYIVLNMQISVHILNFCHRARIVKCWIVGVQSLSHVRLFCNLMDYSLPGSSVHEIFLGKNTGMGCHFLLQGIFLTQGLNLCLLHWQVDSLPLSFLETQNAGQIGPNCPPLKAKAILLPLTSMENAFFSYSLQCEITLVVLQFRS